MGLRLLRRQHDGRDPLGPVRMLLKRAVPEVVRVVVLADEEAGIGRLRIGREGEREGDLRLGPVRPAGAASEGERLEIANAASGEGRRIGFRIVAAEGQHGEPFAAGEVIAHEGAEAEGARPVRRDAAPLPHGDQLDERAFELDEPVLRAPRMAVAGADLEAEPLVESGGHVEIANGDHQVVDAAWGHGSCPVGVSPASRRQTRG